MEAIERNTKPELKTDDTYEGRACRALEAIAETLQDIDSQLEALNGCLRHSSATGTAFDVHVVQ